MPVELTAYEAQRARNIEANNARLVALGLISKEEELKSNAAAWKRHLPPPEKIGQHGTKKRKSSDNPKASIPARKSRRIRGEVPEQMGLEEDDDEGNRRLPRSQLQDDETAEERMRRVEECRRVRQIAANKYADIHGAEKAAQENPTATYGHCLHRIKTMSDKGLANRVKAIERAAGKHCVVKMAIFKSCLQDEDMWDLAELASEALERLKALQAPP